MPRVDMIAHRSRAILSPVDHCPNFDPQYEGCRDCPGSIAVKQANGTVDTLCQAGAKKVQEIATAYNNLPVFPIPFPADDGR